MRKQTRLKVIGVIAAAVMALTAVAAQGASAATWTAPNAFANGNNETLKSAAELMGTSTFTGTISGTAVEITATSLEVVGGVIKQNGTKAEVTGKLKFGGLTLDKPIGCSPPSSITTVELTGEVKEISGKTYLLIKPSSGTTFATVTLTGSCAIAGTPFKVTTSSYVCGETNPLGTMAVKQRLTISPTIVSACGGNLSAGGNAATLTGEATIEVSSGASWGAF